MSTMRAYTCVLVLLACAVLSTAQYCVNNPGSCVRFRQTPGTSGAIITCAPHRARMNPDGQVRMADGMNWRRMSYNGHWGWIAAQFLQICAADPVEDPAQGGDGIDLTRFPTSYAASPYTFTGARAQTLHFLKQRFGTRASTYSSHSEGPLNSADLYTPDATWNVDTRNSAKMNELADFIAAHLNELGVKYVIWKQRIFNVSNPQWRQMEDRGSITQNHFDHVHITFA